MRIVVVGGTGQIGSKVVLALRSRGHDAVPAAPSLGVNALTGEGLNAAIAAADVVVDVSNSPSFEDEAVLTFFQTSGRNLLAAEAAAGVRHHVALSVVGADLLPDSGYMRAKVAQEELIRGGATPYTIVRATQFFEFLGAIAESGATVGTIRLPAAPLQPIAAEDVATALVEIALSEPVNGTIELAGPERLPMDEAVRRYLQAKRDARPVVADADARYFGAELRDASLTPRGQARIGALLLARWLERLREPAIPSSD